ncbi:MAG: TSUP family transporter [Chloroherpetonaceae bacterium]|nr:TSUP family transporter [Chloroherpetonaceae bacterium]
MSGLELVVVSSVALFASFLTFFSGFGLGTLLTPAFALFFPVETAISLTAVAHFLNNLFKLLLVGGFADREIVMKFGASAVVASFIGALVLSAISSFEPIFAYRVLNREAIVTPVKTLVGVLLLAFVWLESRESLAAFKVKREHLWLGGLLSGFFGGLSGHQGAIRSAFLLKCDLTKEAYVATGVAIACLIDVARLLVYRERFILALWEENLPALAAATVSAFAGAFIGSLLMRKVTIAFVQRLAMAMLVMIAVLLICGAL